MKTLTDFHNTAETSVDLYVQYAFKQTLWTLGGGVRDRKWKRPPLTSPSTPSRLIAAFEGKK